MLLRIYTAWEKKKMVLNEIYCKMSLIPNTINGRRHLKLFTNCHVSCDTLYVILSDFLLTVYVSLCTVYVSLCTFYLQSMYNLCTVYVHYMYSLCAVYVQSMYSLCTVYVQSM